MNEQDKELVNKHAGCFGNIIFTASSLNEFLAERDALKHKELLAIHEVLQCIGCEHEANADDTWTVKGVKQLAERVQKSEAALNSQAKSVPEGWKLVPTEPTEDMGYAAEKKYIAMQEETNVIYGATSFLVEGYKSMLASAPQPPQSIEADKVQELEKDSQPKLEVVIRSFPESNGKQNWTAQLIRADKSWEGLVGNCGGITIARSEFWNRVAYEAERTRFLLGQRITEPCILDYSEDIRTPEEWVGEVNNKLMKEDSQ